MKAVKSGGPYLSEAAKHGAVGGVLNKSYGLRGSI